MLERVEPPGVVGAAAARAEAIRFDAISKRYGDVVALSEIDLSVRKGELLTLLGPSGSGKTTLLNIVSGAVAPSAGRLFLDGEDITRKPPRERGLGMVFQHYALIPHMSVAENVAFPLKVRGWKAAAIRRQVAAMLEVVGLASLGNRRPRELSGGQQQRVAIARCLAYSPSIILMDEPLGALDKKLREQLQGEIKRLHRDIGTTLIYVTHDQEEALNLSDTICLMNGGRIEQLGTPEQLYFEPRNTFVADFVGESNLFSGSVVGEHVARLRNGMDLEFADARGVPSGTTIKLLVRPEKMIVGGSADAAGVNALTGTVRLVSFVGGMTRIEASTDDGMPFVAKAISSRVVHRSVPGDRIHVTWSAADTIVLIE